MAIYDVTLETQDKRTRCPKKVAALAARGWELSCAVKDAKAELETVNAALIEALGAGAKIVSEHAAVTLAERQTTTVVDVERLRAVLGGRFEDLVKSDTKYTVGADLKTIASDAGHPLQAAVSACLKISASTAVTYRVV